MTDEMSFYPDKMGHRKYTLESLQEKVEDQFRMETEGRTDLLLELDTRAKRIEAVREAADYVLANEYVNLPADEKRQIVEKAVANLFYFGAVDQYLRDEAITEITLEGGRETFIRRGFEELQPIPAPYRNIAELESNLTRIVAAAGAILTTTEPFVEVGVNVHQRPARVSAICPPINPMYSVQIRLHPLQPFQLDQLIPHPIPAVAADLLRQIITANRGLLVTGEVGVGKTTLLTALLHQFTDTSGVVVVERAREMSLPEGITRRAAIPPKPETPAQDFSTQIQEALTLSPRALVLDEIRGDEGQALLAALQADIPQMMMAFRGGSNPARLYSALGITLRKAQSTLESDLMNRALLAKLPFVAVLQHPRKNQPPRLMTLSQWVEQSGSLTLEPLVIWPVDGEPYRTDKPLR